MRGLAALSVALALAVVAPGCGGGETVTPEPETVEGAIPEEEAPDLAQGDAQAGKEVFNTANPACGTCHTFEAAGTTATLGPDLDELEGPEAEPEHVYESIVNPNAEISEGFQPDVMPKDYGQKLTDKQLADLVAFLTQQRKS